MVFMLGVMGGASGLLVAGFQNALLDVRGTVMAILGGMLGTMIVAIKAFLPPVELYDVSQPFDRVVPADASRACQMLCLPR